MLLNIVCEKRLNFCKLDTLLAKIILQTMNKIFNKKIGSIRLVTVVILVLIFVIYFLYEALR